MPVEPRNACSNLCCLLELKYNEDENEERTESAVNLQFGENLAKPGNTDTGSAIG
jgi:hypothetical protein